MSGAICMEQMGNFNSILKNKKEAMNYIESLPIEGDEFDTDVSTFLKVLYDNLNKEEKTSMLVNKSSLEHEFVRNCELKENEEKKSIDMRFKNVLMFHIANGMLEAISNFENLLVNDEQYQRAIINENLKDKGIQYSIGARK